MDSAPIEEPHVGLVDQVGRLPASRVTLTGQQPPRHPAEFQVHQGGELFQGLCVATAPCLEQAGEVRDPKSLAASLPGQESGRLHFVPSDSACVGERTTEPSTQGASKEGICDAWVGQRRAAAIAAVVMGGARVMGADGQDDTGWPGKPCSEATVGGDYGIQIQGTRPAPGGFTESVVGVVFGTVQQPGEL